MNEVNEFDDLVEELSGIDLGIPKKIKEDLENLDENELVLLKNDENILDDDTEDEPQKIIIDSNGFTNLEISYISSLAKDRRFEFKSTSIIYPRTYKEQLEYFVKCMRLLSTIINQINDDKILKDKLLIFYSKYENIFLDSLKIIEKLDRDIEFGRSRLNYRLNNLYISNKDKIFNVIDFIYPLGKRTLNVDISQTPAYY